MGRGHGACHVDYATGIQYICIYVLFMRHDPIARRACVIDAIYEWIGFVVRAVSVVTPVPASVRGRCPAPYTFRCDVAAGGLDVLHVREGPGLNSGQHPVPPV